MSFIQNKDFLFFDNASYQVSMIRNDNSSKQAVILESAELAAPYARWFHVTAYARFDTVLIGICGPNHPPYMCVPVTYLRLVIENGPLQGRAIHTYEMMDETQTADLFGIRLGRGERVEMDVRVVINPAKTELGLQKIEDLIKL